MTITTMDALVAGLGAGFRSSFYRASVTVSAASSWASWWTIGGQPGAGAIPPTGAGEVPTNATAGALLFTNPAGGGSSYLANFLGSCVSLSLPYLYDRLVHTSGLVANVTTLQTVNSASVNRPDSTAANTELFLEVYSQTGATAVTPTVTYTNQSGTTGRTTAPTTALVANCRAGQIVPIQLASGDSGVQSVQSVQLSATTGSAGNFGITIGRRLAMLPIGAANGSEALDPFRLGLPSLPNNACLWLVAFSATSTTPGPLHGQIAVAQG